MGLFQEPFDHAWLNVGSRYRAITLVFVTYETACQAVRKHRGIHIHQFYVLEWPVGHAR